MKSTIVICLIFCFSGFHSYSKRINETEVPESIKKVFIKTFPENERVRWDLDRDDNYKAIFYIERDRASAKYDENGNCLETKMYTDTSDIPDKIKKKISKKYKDFKINKVEKITVLKEGVSYEMELTPIIEKIEISVSPSGEITEKIKDNDGKSKFHKKERKNIKKKRQSKKTK
ncbi:PepSY-like domain-containing protein [Bacteroidota bacterium]